MMEDITVCLGVGCKIRTKCGRFGRKVNEKSMVSVIAACKGRVAFVGKKPFKKVY